MAEVLVWGVEHQGGSALETIEKVLRSGGLTLLPSDAGYLLVGSAHSSDTIQKISRLSLCDPGHFEFFIHHSRFHDFVDRPMSGHLRRMTARLWPGLCGVMIPDDQVRPRLKTSALGAVQNWRFRQPNHAIFDQLLALPDLDLFSPVMREIHSSVDELSRECGPWLSLIVDAGKIQTNPVSRIEVRNSSWRMVQEGYVDEQTIVEAMCRWIAFVCTGNTCRSPMAEAFAKSRLSTILGCTIDELPKHGYFIFSAGVAARPGNSASPQTIEFLQSCNIDGTTHQSQNLSEFAVAHTDWLIGMTRSHLQAILARYPIIGGSLRLMLGSDGDLEDPIGGDDKVYSRCAFSILNHMDDLLLEIIGR